MPPLTLEQVLARSMRLPRQRTQQQVSRLLKGPAADGALPSLGETGARSSWSSSSGFTSTSTRGTRASATAAGQGKLSFFEMMDRDDAKRHAGRLSIHSSGHLVRNSADLTTYLQGARCTGDWEGGLRAFVNATATPALALTTPAEDDAGAASPSATPAPSALTLAAAGTGIHPNTLQVNALLDVCVGAEKWALVERIGTYFAPTHPDAFTHVVELLAQRVPLSASASPSTAASGWRAAFDFVALRCPLPAAEVPVAAFNVCLRGCEAALDWRGALEVVRAMGPNPLQGWRSADEGAEASSGAAATDEGVGADAGAAEAALRSLPPPPDVVSYATLIATLEQSGKEGLASEVLNRLPPLEKEEITASYAALITVWSTQILRRQRRRF